MNLQYGDIIGTNKIIQKDASKSREYWICECILCHKIRSVRSDDLAKTDRSCAAKIRNQKHTNIRDDLTGRHFGKWTVLGKAKKPNYWHCRCECGTERDVFRGSLINGDSKGCGCTKSWQEDNIAKLLQQYNINYIKEYSNPDLKTFKNGYCRFDFAILDDDKENIICFIEYDGRQHFEYDKNWNQTLEEFEYRQELDHFKDEYAQKIGIPLIRLNQSSDIEKTIQNLRNYNFTQFLPCEKTSKDRTPDYTLDIIDDLKNNTSLTINQIAEKYNVSRGTVSRINHGEPYLSSEHYPIRSFKRAIICLNTNQIFSSCEEASQWCDIAASNISRCAKGGRPTAGKHPETGEKLKWRFVEDEI